MDACRMLLVENSLQALLVCELSVANGSAALQRKVSELKDAVVFSFFWKANLVRECHSQRRSSTDQGCV